MSAVADSDVAEDCISVAEDATLSTTDFTVCSKPSASLCIAAFCSAAARFFNSSCSAPRRAFSIMLFLKTSTAAAIWPTSSLRPRAGIATEWSLAASVRMASHIRVIGPEIPRPMSQASTAPSSKPPTDKLRMSELV